MKPLNNKLIVAGAVLLAVASLQTAAYAQGGNPPTPNGSGLVLVLSIAGTATIVNPNTPPPSDNGKATTTKYESLTLKTSTTSILDLISNDFETTFSSKAVLVYNGGTTLVVDGTNLPVDVTSDITISLGNPNVAGVWTGTDTASDTTSADVQKFTGTYLFGITFQDGAGDTANLGGLATETYTDGVDENGNPTKASDSISVSLIGDGLSQQGSQPTNFKLTLKGTGSPTLTDQL